MAHRCARRLVDLVAPDAHLLRQHPEEMLHVLRLLTFAGSHAEIADDDLMTPEEIVDVVLNGMLAAPQEGKD